MFVTLIRQKFKSVWGEQGITHNTGNVLEQGFSALPKTGNADRIAEQGEQLCACSGDV